MTDTQNLLLSTASVAAVLGGKRRWNDQLRGGRTDVV
jgi:hypothetical protein